MFSDYADNTTFIIFYVTYVWYHALLNISVEILTLLARFLLCLRVRIIERPFNQRLNSRYSVQRVSETTNQKLIFKLTSLSIPYFISNTFLLLFQLSAGFAVLRQYIREGPDSFDYHNDYESFYVQFFFYAYVLLFPLQGFLHAIFYFMNLSQFRKFTACFKRNRSKIVTKVIQEESEPRANLDGLSDNLLLSDNCQGDRIPSASTTIIISSGGKGASLNDSEGYEMSKDSDSANRGKNIGQVRGHSNSSASASPPVAFYSSSNGTELNNASYVTFTDTFTLASESNQQLDESEDDRPKRSVSLIHSNPNTYRILQDSYDGSPSDLPPRRSTSVSNNNNNSTTSIATPLRLS